VLFYATVFSVNKDLYKTGDEFARERAVLLIYFGSIIVEHRVTVNNLTDIVIITSSKKLATATQIQRGESHDCDRSCMSHILEHARHYKRRLTVR